MAVQGLTYGGEQLSANKYPPTGCYFEVSFYPAWLNPLKMVLLSQDKAYKKLAWALAGTPIVGNTIASSIIDGEPNYEAIFGGLLPSLGLNPLDFRFNKVSGLAQEIEVEDIRVGGMNTQMLQLPNRVVHDNLVLERGIFIGSPLTIEFGVAMNLFVTFPGEVLVTLQTPDKIPISAWVYRNAYPVAWSNSDLWSDDNDVAMETMEFAYSHCVPLRI